jgi:hypothetical protein
MASNTYTAIATVTVGSGGAANIEFTSIPATYTDLLVKLSGRSTSGGETAVNLRFKSLAGDGSSASSASSTSQPEVFVGRISANTYTASTFGNMEIYIPNYTGSSNKSLSSDSVAENNATTGYNILIAGLWNNTAAITSIAFTVAGSNFAQYSTATLYGIKNS